MPNYVIVKIRVKKRSNYIKKFNNKIFAYINIIINNNKGYQA